MKNFASVDPHRNFESPADPAHASGVNPEDHHDRRETHASRDRADGPECHAADVGNTTEAARETARRIAQKEICADEPCAEEITAEMIDAGAYLLSQSYDQARDWFTCEQAAEIYVTMRSLAYATPR